LLVQFADPLDALLFRALLFLAKAPPEFGFSRDDECRRDLPDPTSSRLPSSSFQVSPISRSKPGFTLKMRGVFAGRAGSGRR
jgi:hypothetical protein